MFQLTIKDMCISSVGPKRSVNPPLTALWKFSYSLAEFAFGTLNQTTD